MGRYRKIVDDFITPEECTEYIQLAEDYGFEEAKIRTRQGDVIDKKIRDNYRVIWDNPPFQDKVWESVKEHLPNEVDGFQLSGLNERFRFYRYEDGQQFRPHMDAPHRVSETELSKITLLIYLNEDFKGGETMMILENKLIEPKAGRLFLFEQKVLHCGLPTTEGLKYVLRTDVMYKLM